MALGKTGWFAAASSIAPAAASTVAARTASDEPLANGATAAARASPPGPRLPDRFAPITSRPLKDSAACSLP